MSDARQLLGMKGASGTSNIWKLRLQLMKPVTWIPLIWGVVCGAAASGNYEWRLDHVAAALGLHGDEWPPARWLHPNHQ